MSLIVSAYQRRADGSINYLEERPPAPQNDLAGFEVTRTRLWGAPIMRRLALRILPSLAKGDVFAEGDDLDRLEEELATIRGALVTVAQETEYDEEFIRFRVDNIAAAISLARAARGGVYIG